MDMKDVSRYQDLIMAAVTNIGLKLLAAIVFWVIGRWLASDRPKSPVRAPPSQWT